MDLEKIISQIADQSIEQVSLILNYDDAFNSIIVAEIKKENDPIAKISKLIHILIERLISLQNIDLMRFQKSISKLFPMAPQDISALLNWIPQKIKKERNKMEPNIEKKQSNIDENQEKSQKNQKLRKEIEHLKHKCTTFSNTIALIKENMENSSKQSNSYLEEIKRLKQINSELTQSLNKEKSSDINTKSYNSIEIQTIDNDSNSSQSSNLGNQNYDSLKERFEIVLCELKTVKSEKEKMDKQYLSNIESLSNLDERMRSFQIERDAAKSNLNDILVKYHKLELDLSQQNEKYELLSQKCLRYETYIAKLKDKLKFNQANEIQSTSITQNYMKAPQMQNENAFRQQLNF